MNGSRTELWWIGRGPEDEAGMDQARAHLEAEFGGRVVRAVRGGRPDDGFDVRRKQYSSARMLKWLAAELPAGSERIVGVTDEDLFIPILTYVFGEAQLGGAAAVVSTARLRAGGPGGAGQRLFRNRLVKECAHELGHAFGLVHCAAGGCVMGRSVSVVDVDSKSGSLCQDCRIRLRELRQRGGQG